MDRKFEEIINNAYDYEEALERQGIKQEDVDLLREKIKKSKLVPQYINDKQLLLFVNACRGDIEKSSKWIHIYYKMKRNAPEFFADRDVLSDEIQTAFRDQIYLCLPVTPSGCNVIFHKLKSFDHRKFIFNTTIKTFIMTAEASIFRNGPRDGTILIYDLEGGGMRHLFQPSMSSVKKGLEFLQVGSPLNVSQVHIFNTTYIMDLIFSMIKPFLKAEMIARIHLHRGGMPTEDFFEKFVPRSHMPKDYGGDLPSVAELHEQNCQFLLEKREYFLLERQHMELKFEFYLNNNNNESVDSDTEDDFSDAKEDE